MSDQPTNEVLKPTSISSSAPPATAEAPTIEEIEKMAEKYSCDACSERGVDPELVDAYLAGAEEGARREKDRVKKLLSEFARSIVRYQEEIARLKGEQDRLIKLDLERMRNAENTEGSLRAKLDAAKTALEPAKLLLQHTTTFEGEYKRVCEALALLKGTGEGA